jgi:hypothetical protein
VGEYKQTRGVALPPGFGLNLKTSDDPTSYKWQTNFEPFGSRNPDGSVYSRRFFILLFLVALMVLMALFLV